MSSAWIQQNLVEMVSLAAAKASNAQYRPAFRPVLVVFGGTNGIGAGIVRTFANYTHASGIGSHIVIVGRSQASADALIASLPAGANSQYEFRQVDAMLVRNIRALARELVRDLPRINYLILSQGAMMLDATPTEEGLHPTLALMVYGRARAVLDLAPALEKAALAGEDARVMFMGAPGTGGPIDLDNLLALDKGWAAVRETMITYKDIATLVRRSYSDYSLV